MAGPTKNNGVEQGKPPEKKSRSYEAFCVALASGGKPVRVTGSTPGDFVDTLKDSTLAWVNFSVEDVKVDGEYIATSLGFSAALISGLFTGRQSAYEDLDIEMGMMLPAVKIDNLEVIVRPLLILLRKGIILTIHRKDVTRFVRFARYADTIMKKIPSSATSVDRISIILTRILDENNERNFDGLRVIEDQADVLSRDLMDPKTPRSKLGPEIYKMKHALISYLNMLWASLDVLNSLRYGDADIITDNPKLLQKISFLADDVNRQISLGEHMSEVLASGLEVLQTIYNNQLQILNNRLNLVNNRLALLAAWLAIMGTAVLVPNTIATVFGIPYFPLGSEWWPVVLGVIILSTMWAAWVTYLVVMKKGWILPTWAEVELED